jgi:type I restriction enzyme R subunit
MKAKLGDVVFIGFTGTPLLKADKRTSLEVFGKYIHTYKFNEAVADGVVKDLVYEARDVDQWLSSPKRIDEWFDINTKDLNDFQKAELKKKWGTMQKLLGSKSRMEKIVSDIQLDFRKRPRLSSGRGNAILVASSIFEACRYFELFQATEFKGKCAIITSYDPVVRDVVMEDTGDNTETDKEFIYRVYTELVLTGYKTETSTYEDWAKDKFKKEPAQMCLLVVVDKLLTGFDAPPCSYLYIDKSMKDHGLFQAITRVNRLDTDDKLFGYIIDYKDLFKKVESAVAVYTTELDYDNFKKEDVDILLKNRLQAGKERLDEAVEQIEALCEPVQPPKNERDYIHYFCGNPENAEDLKEKEVQRTTLYKMTVALLRAFANIKDEMQEAGYTDAEANQVESKVTYYINIREVIKNASGEKIDLKAYESDMRHLLDRYVAASESRQISHFDENMTLLDIIVKAGIHEGVGSLPGGIKKDKEAVSETIANNVRSKIIKDHLLDPAYFEKMSKLLEELVKARKAGAVSYEEYLEKIAELARNVNNPANDTQVPASIKTMAQRALYHNLDNNETLALQVDGAILASCQAEWRGNVAKENMIKAAMYQVLGDIDKVEMIFEIVKQQQDY